MICSTIDSEKKVHRQHSPHQTSKTNKNCEESLISHKPLTHEKIDNLTFIALQKWPYYVKPAVYKGALVRLLFIFKRKPNTICLVAADAMTPAVHTAEFAAILFVWDVTDWPAIRLIAAVDHTIITLISSTWVWINDITCLLLFHFTEVLNFKENLY